MNKYQKEDKDIEKCNRLDGDSPRYLLEPFEVIRPSDPRYASALTHEEAMKMADESARK